jgi:shikimate kinase
MWLVGMMGSGKTRAGRIAAASLGVAFADTDEQVELLAGQPLDRIWMTLGEQGFREVEREAIVRLADFEGIVATGGGVVVDPGNRGVMAPGTVVWLKASPEELADRVVGEAGRRPLLRGDPVRTLRDLLESRETLYQKIAQHEIDTEGLGLEEVAERIEALWSG